MPSAKPGEKSAPKERPGLRGLYLGTVEAFDSRHRYIFVRPLIGRSPRRTFYIDEKTIYRRQRVRIPPAEVSAGQKIGIRYLSANHLFVAEGIFVIPEEVELRDLQMPRKKKAPEPAAEGEGKKEGGGGHAAAPPKPPAPKPPAPKPKHE